MCSMAMLSPIYIYDCVTPNPFVCCRLWLPKKKRLCFISHNAQFVYRLIAKYWADLSVYLSFSLNSSMKTSVIYNESSNQINSCGGLAQALLIGCPSLESFCKCFSIHLYNVWNCAVCETVILKGVVNYLKSCRTCSYGPNAVYCALWIEWNDSPFYKIMQIVHFIMMLDAQDNHQPLTI